MWHYSDTKAEEEKEIMFLSHNALVIKRDSKEVIMKSLTALQQFVRFWLMPISDIDFANLKPKNERSIIADWIVTWHLYDPTTFSMKINLRFMSSIFQR